MPSDQEKIASLEAEARETQKHILDLHSRITGLTKAICVALKYDKEHSQAFVEVADEWTVKALKLTKENQAQMQSDIARNRPNLN